MAELFTLLNIALAYAQGYVCWPELHAAGWVEWICRLGA